MTKPLTIFQLANAYWADAEDEYDHDERRDAVNPLYRTGGAAAYALDVFEAERRRLRLSVKLSPAEVAAAVTAAGVTGADLRARYPRLVGEYEASLRHLTETGEL